MPLPSKQPGDPLGAREVNEILRNARKSDSIKGSGGVVVRNAGGGINISLSREVQNRWWGKIVAKGKNDEADYTDERYWVQRCRFTGGASATAKLALTAETGTDNPFNVIATASNIEEMLDGTHSLSIGTPVEVFEQTSENATPSTMCYLRKGPKPGVVWIYILSNAAQNGTYHGKIAGSPSTILSDATISPMNVFVSAGGTTDCIVLNMTALDQAGHTVSSLYGLPYPCFYVTKTTDGTPVYGTYAFNFNNCSNETPENDPDYEDAPDDGGDDGGE